MIASYSRVFIVVDALDESSASDGCRAGLVLELFCLRDTCKPSVSVTSRAIPDITQEFDEDVSKEIRASDRDVERYLCGP